MKWKRALVTGASSGIGWAMAQQLAAEGTALVVVARDKGRLEELAASLSVDVEVLPADLGNPAEVSRIAERIEADEDRVDLVINNAGFGTTGALAEQSVDSQQTMVAVNVAALVQLSQVAARIFRARGAGGILNVSSVASFVPAAGSATYAATKAFVTSFSQSLQTELLGTGVHVTALCPGLTRTEFQDRAEADVSKVPAQMWQTADEVAKAGLRAVAKNRAVEIPGAHNKALVGGSRLMPPGVLRRISGMLTD